MTPGRLFRFGVMLHGATTRSAWVEKVRKAEDLGYSSVFIPDHFSDQLAPIPALMLAAEAGGLRLVTGVLANDFKHPVVLAKEAATLDLLSDGRLELGIGAGWDRAEYRKAGMRFDPPGARIDRLAESIAIIKGLFGAGPVSFHGEHYQIDALEGSPKPAQIPHPPILVGGGAGRILGLAGREADIVGINVSLESGEAVPMQLGPNRTAAATDEKLGWVRAAAGDRFRDLELNVLVVVVEVTKGRLRVAEDVAAKFGITPVEVLGAPQILVGTPRQMRDDLEARRATWGISYIAVLEHLSEDLAPVVAALRGS